MNETTPSLVYISSTISARWRAAPHRIKYRDEFFRNTLTIDQHSTNRLFVDMQLILAPPGIRFDGFNLQTSKHPVRGPHGTVHVMEQTNENENEYPPDNRPKTGTNRIPATQSTINKMAEPRQAPLNEFLTKMNSTGQ
ncbi:hypothetical protein [Burkholderia sp. SCN-KJ]|uniref:hypothetical protein n=1 Tax=Burkholderia sp. SCN-KJ TaxID=2969248 RepID=UPI0021500038|nr:hypothetical protein [Burkholderia sp. SCN-KJ]MCR4470614.1 hypothetical protein [Burkholderia sp. SCN-KJ]